MNENKELYLPIGLKPDETEQKQKQKQKKIDATEVENEIKINKEILSKIRQYKYDKVQQIEMAQKRKEEREIKKAKLAKEAAKKKAAAASAASRARAAERKSRDDVFDHVVKIMKDFVGLKVSVSKKKYDGYSYRSTKQNITGPIKCSVHSVHKRDKKSDQPSSRVARLIVDNQTILRVFVRMSIYGPFVSFLGQDRYPPKKCNSMLAYETNNDGASVKIKYIEAPIKDSDYDKFKEDLIKYIGDMCIES